VPENLRDVSRLELLLAPKQGSKVFQPAGNCEASQRVNKAIKFAAQWTDVQRAVGSGGDISPGNSAFAIYRLGCLTSFASKKRNAGRPSPAVLCYLTPHTHIFLLCCNSYSASSAKRGLSQPNLGWVRKQRRTYLE